MGFARKARRKRRINTLREMGVYCCGQPMMRKHGYDTEDKDFYFCEKCGKERFI